MRRFIECKKQYRKDQQIIKSFDKLYGKNYRII